MKAPRFQEVASAFNLNRAMHQLGSAIKVQSDHLLLMFMSQDRQITYTYFYELGAQVSIADQFMSVKDFWRYLASKYPPAQPTMNDLLDFNTLSLDGDIDLMEL